MLVSPSGRVMLLALLHPLNTPSASVRTPAGTVISGRLMQ